MVKSSAALRWDLYWVYLISFLFFLRLTIPILAVFSKINDINSGDPNKTTSQSSFVFLTFGVLSQITELLFVKYVGSFSDYIGRKPLLFLSSILYAIAYAMLASTRDNNVFYLASVISSIVATVPVNQAWVVDLISEESRGKALGIFIGVSVGFAFMIGLPLGAALSTSIGYDGVIWISVIISLFAGFVTIVAPTGDTVSAQVKLENRESIPVESTLLATSRESSNPIHGGSDQQKHSSQPTESRRTCGNITWGWFYRNFIKDRTFPPSWKDFITKNHFLTGFSIINEARTKMTFFLYFWATCGNQVLSMVFLPYANVVFHWTVAESGYAITFIFFVIAIFNPLMLNYYHEDNLFGVGTLITTIGYLLISVAGTNLNITVRVIVGMFGLLIVAFSGFYFPAVLTMISRQYPEHKQGEALAVVSQLEKITSLIVYPTNLTFTAAISKDSKIYWPGVVFFVSGLYFVIATAAHIKIEGWRTLTLKRKENVGDKMAKTELTEVNGEP